MVKRIHISLLLLFAFLSLTSAQAQTVYTTKTGTKYHRETCRYLKYSKYAVSLKEAKEKGYTPCKVCRPAATVTNNRHEHADSVIYQQKQQAPVKYATSRRCTATTKAGTRCKRMTKNADQRCWQHMMDI